MFRRVPRASACAKVGNAKNLLEAVEENFSPPSVPPQAIHADLESCRGNQDRDEGTRDEAEDRGECGDDGAYVGEDEGGHYTFSARLTGCLMPSMWQPNFTTS